jgi:hypothetical protein
MNPGSADRAADGESASGPVQAGRWRGRGTWRPSRGRAAFGGRGAFGIDRNGARSAEDNADDEVRAPSFRASIHPTQRATTCRPRPSTLCMRRASHRPRLPSNRRPGLPRPAMPRQTPRTSLGVRGETIVAVAGAAVTRAGMRLGAGEAGSRGAPIVAHRAAAFVDKTAVEASADRTVAAPPHAPYALRSSFCQRRTSWTRSNRACSACSMPARCGS